MKKIKFDKIISLILFMYILSLYLFTYKEGLFIISNGLAFLFVFMVSIRILFNKGKVVFNRYLIYHMIFISICTFSLIYAVDKNNVIIELRALLLTLLVMIAIVNFVDTYDKIHFTIKSFIISGLISSIYILLISDFTNIVRFGSELGNQNAVGMMIGISAIFSFNEYVKIKKKKNLIALIIMLIVILLTGSRKALIFIILSMLLIIYFKNKKNLKGYVKIIVISSVIFIGSFYIVTEIPIFYDIIGKRLEGLLAIITGTGKVDNSSTVRKNMIDYGLEIFKDKPLLGYGAKNYSIMFGKAYGVERYAHNNFIELLVNVGVLGTCAYYLTNIKIVKSLHSYIRKTKDGNLAYPFIAIVAVYFLLGISLVYYDSKHYSFILALASVIPTYIQKNKKYS